MMIKNLFNLIRRLLYKPKTVISKTKVLELLPSSLGGAAMHVDYILRHIDNDKLDVSIVFPNDGGKVIDLTKHKHKKININKRISIWRLRKLKKFIIKNNIELVHVHGFRAAFNLWLLRVLGRVNIKYVYTIHGFHSLRYGSFLRRIIQKYIERRVIKKSSRVILVSEQDKKDGLKKRMFKEEDAVVIKNGVDISKYDIEIDKEQKKKELNVLPDEKIIGFTSRLHKVKGLEYLLKAMPIIVSQIKAKLILVGQGPERKKLKKLAKKLSLEKEVIFLGERADVPELLNIMDVVVLPSLWEGMPYSLLEAMAAGKPIIASDVCGIRELIKDGETGILIKPRNHNLLARGIVNVLDNSELRLRLIRNAREEVKRYSAYEMVKKIESVYESELGA